MEEWKYIEGYEGLYQVSNYGRVRSLFYRKKNQVQLLKLRKVTKGYLQVALWKNRKRKDFMVHKLVAEAFIPNPNNYPQINHKDEDKTNNCVENLEWCTNEYNHNYGTRNIRAGGGINGSGSNQIMPYRISHTVKPSSMSMLQMTILFSCFAQDRSQT